MTEPTIEESKPTLALGRSTNIQLWLAIIIAIAIGGWAIKDQTWKTTVDMRLTAIETTVANTASTQWTKIEMKLWATQLKLLNTEIVLPDIE